MNIWVFSEGAMGTNCYLVAGGDKTAAIIDAGEYSPRLPRKVKDEGLTVKWLILTHGHGDHIGAVERYLKEFEGCLLVAGADEKEILANPSHNLTGAIFGRNISLEADVWVNDGDELECGDLPLKIIATPGHTPGGICVLAGDALFSGDTLFRASIGRTDFPGGSFETLISSIKDKLLPLPDGTRVYPGHMEASTIGFERGHNPFL
ncbi:MAG: MBL fold metallo-hydrolase [Clostridiales Family XIII bacterium]|jgi:glyoxylase-like metal-dependent hydrolase (beta-lactamase superfamily II)|nr:MBL fold metallo-hydrolase [Clostridiales Family XIII bacterium]